MSDMMRPGPPMGGPPSGPPPGGMDVRNKMSVMNPADMAAKVTRGDIRPNQSVGEFLQKNYGVSPTDPVQKLFAAVKAQAQNATVGGKMGAPPRPGGPPMGAAPGAPPMGAPPTSMDDLANRL
jgi:hypothetical protein